MRVKLPAPYANINLGEMRPAGCGGPTDDNILHPAKIPQTRGLEAVFAAAGGVLGLNAGTGAAAFEVLRTKSLVDPGFRPRGD